MYIVVAIGVVVTLISSCRLCVAFALCRIFVVDVRTISVVDSLSSIRCNVVVHPYVVCFVAFIVVEIFVVVDNLCNCRYAVVVVKLDFFVVIRIVHVSVVGDGSIVALTCFRCHCL